MRKLVSAIVAGSLALALVGCGGGESAGSSQQQQPAGSSEPAAKEELRKEQPKKKEESKYHASYDAPDEPAPYIKETSWHCVDGEPNGGKYLIVDYILGCTDQVNCYVFPKVKVTARAADGTVLGSADSAAVFVAPNDVMPVSFQITVAEEPAEVTFDLSYDPGEKPGNDYTLADLPVSNDGEFETNGFTKWTGEFTNQTGVSFDSGCDAYVLLRKDGDLVATYRSIGVSPVEDGATSSFEISQHSGTIPEYDSHEFLIVPNLF